MQAVSERELREIARLVEVTSDAVALCQPDGTILHVNQQLLALLKEERDGVVGADIKDLIYSDMFERAEGHRLPFSLEGTADHLMLKVLDGSFIPVEVRALKIFPKSFLRRHKGPQRVLVAIRSLEEEYARDRRTRRLMAELSAANKRLSGTLSVIMSAVGAEDMAALMDAVLNKLSSTLDAYGATMYFAENGGFKLRGASQSLMNEYLPDFVPFGTGIATHVLREGRSCRISVVPGAGLGPLDESSFYDLDSRASSALRVQDTPPFKTLIAVPVFFGTQVLGIIELGWKRPTTPRESDARVLEVVCDYLSIQLVGLASQMRAERAAELTRSLNRLREALFGGGADLSGVWADMMAEVSRVLGCRVCPVLPDEAGSGFVMDYEGGSRVALPGDIETLFFGTMAPAARTDVGRAGVAVSQMDAPSLDDLASVRVVRVDRTGVVGEWLRDHGLPCQGAFIDLGPEAAEVDDPGGDEAAQPGGTAVLACVRAYAQHRMFLLLRNGSQEPIDNAEFDYLVHLAHDYERITSGARKEESERRIAQALQYGMRSKLGEVPGITADSLYSSATKQALVGGDFYTLIRLPDDRAVMILGDVSGKGVEAASMSALVKTALTAYAWEGAGPSACARSLNSMLMGFSRVETFVTMFIAKIDLRAKIAVYCSCGHPPTMLVHPARGGVEAGEVELLSVQSGVVGAFESMAYESGSLAFDSGDVLFMYTDGAIEARDSAGDFFGEERLRDAVLRASADGSKGLCDKVLGELDAFTGSALDDDIALVALEFE